jgi:hypothetical protein
MLRDCPTVSSCGRARQGRFRLSSGDKELNRTNPVGATGLRWKYLKVPLSLFLSAVGTIRSVSRPSVSARLRRTACLRSRPLSCSSQNRLLPLGCVRESLVVPPVCWVKLKLLIRLRTGAAAPPTPCQASERHLGRSRFLVHPGSLIIVGPCTLFCATALNTLPHPSSSALRWAHCSQTTL